ncbi:unnamed protein product [Heligmosomoides polygyrus]|uniref:Vta1 domain-containing protein n=1 Tax=Heligmosomoides polygyrus TaxID=6339 RepID=A0A3P8C9A1_HELPZ|nr:unnamed protein product [Heligmosomoides polygyrus]
MKAKILQMDSYYPMRHFELLCQLTCRLPTIGRPKKVPYKIFEALFESRKEWQPKDGRSGNSNHMEDSPRLLVAQSAVLILQGKYKDAEGLPHDAQLCDANNCDALVNLVAVSQFAGENFEKVRKHVKGFEQKIAEYKEAPDSASYSRGGGWGQIMTLNSLLSPNLWFQREEPGNEARDVAPSGKEKKKEAAIASDCEV